MILTIVSCMTLLGHLSMAVPLNTPAVNVTQYFDSRIVGGSLAPPGSSPWMVGLIAGGHFTSFVCGGSIITEKHVATAAHCIAAFIDWHGNLINTLYGVVGTLTWNHGGVIITFVSHDNHPEYNWATLKNDVGLLTMEKKLKFNENIRPIGIYKGFVDGGTPCYVTGWGTEELWGNVPYHLKKLPVYTVFEQQCIEKLSSASYPWPAPEMDYELEICTFHSYGSGMCHGDSGSALVCYDQLVGMVAWGIPCAKGGADIHARMQAFDGFIKEILGEYYS